MSSFIKPKETIRDHIISSMIIFFGLILVGIIFYFIVVPCGQFIIDQAEIELSNANYVIQ